jgi:hypothetical protein
VSVRPDSAGAEDPPHGLPCEACGLDEVGLPDARLRRPYEPLVQARPCFPFPGARSGDDRLSLVLSHGDASLGCGEFVDGDDDGGQKITGHVGHRYIRRPWPTR